MERVYLDNAATTKMFEDVFDETKKYLTRDYYNPSAVYSLSVDIKREILNSRKILLDALVGNGDLVFTGSATEANNMALFSCVNLRNKKFVIGMGEHPSVFECAKELEKKGLKVEYVPLLMTGEVDVEAYKKIVESGDVGFVSIQHVSNETGAINPIAKLVKIARKYNKDVLFHSDGVQAFMKFPYSLLDLDVDYYTISAHKVYGPKGVGALYVKQGRKIKPFIFGGGQENNLRSGTENVFGIVSFGLCVEKLLRSMDLNYEKVKKMRVSLLNELKSLGVNYKTFGEGVPHILSVCLNDNVRGETLVHALENRGVYISTGSACSSTKHMNRTLEVMGVNRNEILCANRISFSPYMDFDAKKIAEIISEELEKLEEKKYE